MILINQCKLPVTHSEDDLRMKLRCILKLNPSEPMTFCIRKRSIDARKKPQIYYVYQIGVEVQGRSEEQLIKRLHNPSVQILKENKYVLPTLRNYKEIGLLSNEDVSGKNSAIDIQDNIDILQPDHAKTSLFDKSDDNAGNSDYIGNKKNMHNNALRPVIVGAGPAGLFAAYLLAEAGCSPIVIERGKPVQQRRADVERFWETGVLDPSSNVLFGEGGAGTFSDGKLNTAIKDPSGRIRFVLETFVRFGAPSEILYELKPHIGTDLLTQVVENMRIYLQEKGCEFHFETQVVDLLLGGIKENDFTVGVVNTDILHDKDIYLTDDGRKSTLCQEESFSGVWLSSSDTKKLEKIPENDFAKSDAFNEFSVSMPRIQGVICESHGTRTTIITDTVILAIGHSARDTFRMLKRHHVPMAAKNFAVGFRVEHPQRMIDEALYGRENLGILPAAPYKVTSNFSNGRGVYSFCMCPGGYVVNASSEPGGTVVNGMSYAARDGQNANSAIVVSVSPRDYMEALKKIEKYELESLKLQENMRNRRKDTFTDASDFCKNVGDSSGSVFLHETEQSDGTDILSHLDNDPLLGMYYQRQLEQACFALGGGRIPQQLYGDYQQNVCSSGYGDFSSQTKGAAAFANLRGLFSAEIEDSFQQGMKHFARIIPGFDRADAILSGVESRTSSPVRILRDEHCESAVRGLYPCGEGAGYAGGITSTAIDGLRVAQATLENKL